MKPFETFRSLTVPLPMKDVDTDQIIPAQYLTSTSRSGYGENLFRRLRDADPQFPLTLPKYRGAEILVTDSNFGCGSSREHAVWALQGAGFKALIGKSFADIFFGNSAKNGLLLVELSGHVIDEILEQSASLPYEIQVNLEEQKVLLSGGKECDFRYDSFRKHCLLHGLEDIDYLLSKKSEIAEYRKRNEATRFFSTLPER